MDVSPAEYHMLLAAASRDNILPLTSACNMECCFCSNEQNPPGVEVATVPALPLEMVEEITGFLNPWKKIIIGESATRLREGEPFTHPELFTILRRVRERFPETPLQITTNGSLLCPSCISSLPGLMPLEIIISLNSATPYGRRRLMKDSNPERAIQAVPLLSKFGIPFHGSVVALPHIVGWDDLRYTLDYLDCWGARTTRVFLPGYTSSTPEGLAFSPTLWEELVHFIKRANRRLNHPVLLEPPCLEDLEVSLEGVLKGSPAARAGLKCGDRIISVAGREPLSRVDAFRMAWKRKNPMLLVESAGKRREVILEKESDETPGFILNFDIDPQEVQAVDAAIRTYHSTRTLLLTSRLGAPLWEKIREKWPFDGELIVSPVDNCFFGGSIKCAGLLVVSDLQQHLREVLPLVKPDLVLLPPGAFDETGRDLTGRSYRDLLLSPSEYELVIPHTA